MNHRLIRISSLIALIVLLVSSLAQAQTPSNFKFTNLAPEVERVLLLEARPTMDVIINFTVAGAYGEASYEAAINSTQNGILAALESTGFVLRHQYRTVPAIAGTISADGLKALQTIPGLYIQEDSIVTTQLLKNNAIINSDDLHDLPSPVTGAGVNVAVLDTGIDPDHPNLVDDLVVQVCYASDCGTYGGPNANDGNGHGTHVSGIITSNAPTAPGVAPDAGIVAVKVLSDAGSGSTSDIVAALEWVLANRVTYDIEIVNMSLGGGSYSGFCDSSEPAYATVITNLRNAGVAVFVATGNSATPYSWSRPACVTAATSVGATYNDNWGSTTWSVCSDPTTAVDQVVCFSNATAMMTMLAPGAKVYSTVPNDTFATYSGTSMATPTAAAMAALLKQADPTLSVSELELLMRGTGVSLLDHRNSQYFPRIDALAAYNAIMGGTLPVFNDNITSPTPLQNGFTESLETGDATSAGSDPTPTCGTNSHSVWYKLNGGGNYSFSTTGSSYSTTIAVFTGTPASLTEIGCSTSGTLNMTAPSGGVYVMVGGTGGTLAVNFVVTAPSNDLVANAVVITTNPFTASLNTTAATNDSTASCVTGFGKTVWYTVISTTGGSANFNTEGSSYDTGLAVYTGTPASLTQVACDDDGGTGLVSNITYTVAANTTYYIAAGGYNGASGNLIFNATVPNPLNSNVPPDVPTILTPTGTITDDSPTYSWTDEEANSYHLYVQGIVAPDTWGDVMNMELFPGTDYICISGSCTYDAGMHNVGDHTAWIRASNTHGWSDWSGGANFFVHVAPDMPVPTAPVGWITDTTPDFTFPEATHAHWYQLWLNDLVGNIYTNWHVATSVCSGGTCAINTALTLDAGLYQYWLQSYNPAEYSAWTSTTYFGVAVVPPAPTAVAPTGTIGDSTPDFVWNWDEEAHWYQIWVSDGVSYSFSQWYDAFVICSGSTCTVNIGALTDGSYTWWLQAWSPADYGAWNAGTSFTVDTTPSVNIAPVVEVAPVIAPAAVEPIQVELP